MSDALTATRNNTDFVIFDPENPRKNIRKVSFKELKEVAKRAKEIFDENEDLDNS